MIVFLTYLLTILGLSVVAQASPGEIAVPPELMQLLNIAFSVNFVTQTIKWAARRINPYFGGAASVVVTAIVSGILTVFSVSAGWHVLVPPDVSLMAAPFEWMVGWLLSVAGAMGLSHLIYEIVYRRVFGRSTT